MVSRYLSHCLLKLWIDLSWYLSLPAGPADLGEPPVKKYSLCGCVESVLRVHRAWNRYRKLLRSI